MWVCAHLWNKASRWVFNKYRHHNLVFVRDPRPGKEAVRITSREGIAQGDPHAMNIFGVTMMPLALRMRRAIPEALQPWYADDSGGTGPAAKVAACLAYLSQHGRKYGYFVEPAKSWYVCKEEDEAKARQVFEDAGLDIKFSRGQRYLGGFIGSEKEKSVWLTGKVNEWCSAVSVLAKVAKKYPQTAYAGFTMVLQNEWQYVQRVVSGTSSFFQPLEAVIRREFIPALFGCAPNEISGEFRELLSHGVKQSGLAIRNPTDTAARVHHASKEACAHLVESLVNDEQYFALWEHNTCAKEALANARSERVTDEMATLSVLGQRNKSVQRRNKRAGHAGAWLTVIPNRLNGTILSAEEFRDNLRLRYNIKPADMCQLCDGCNEPFSVEHALSCKKGGLVHIRHDDVADEFRHLCGTALSFGRVEREPRIFSSVSRRVRVEAAEEDEEQPQQPGQANTNNNNPTAANAQQSTPNSGERGDASCHGFWQRGRTCIFDMRITDPEARSYRNKDHDKVLAAQEKEKKDKYLRSCHEQRKDFTPMVYTVDGVAGREARAAERRVALFLSEKWNRQYSEMAGYVRARMSLSVVRANSLLIRGSRVRQQPRRPQISERAAMFDWQTWQGR